MTPRLSKCLTKSAGDSSRSQDRHSGGGKVRVGSVAHARRHVAAPLHHAREQAGHVLQGQRGGVEHRQSQEGCSGEVRKGRARSGFSKRSSTQEEAHLGAPFFSSDFGARRSQPGGTRLLFIFDILLPLLLLLFSFSFNFFSFSFSLFFYVFLGGQEGIGEEEAHLVAPVFSSDSWARRMENWAPLPKGFPQNNKLGSVRHVYELTEKHKKSSSGHVSIRNEDCVTLPLTNQRAESRDSINFEQHSKSINCHQT